jgi:L-threonylcarbamoyladenylate synthase
MVSTSANISGQDNLNNIDEIINVFNECDDVAYFDDKLGDNNKPLKIIDLHTRAIIRA